MADTFVDEFGNPTPNQSIPQDPAPVERPEFEPVADIEKRPQRHRAVKLLKPTEAQKIAEQQGPDTFWSTIGDAVSPENILDTAKSAIPIYGLFAPYEDDAAAVMAQKRLRDKDYAPDGRQQELDDRDLVTSYVNKKMVDSFKDKTFAADIAKIALDNLGFTTTNLATRKLMAVGKVAVGRALGVVDPTVATEAARKALASRMIGTLKQLPGEKQLVKVTADNVNRVIDQTPGLLKNAIDDEVVNQINRTASTKIITSLAGRLAALPAFQGMAIGRTLEKMAPDIEYDERGRARISEGQGNLIAEFGKAQLGTAIEIVSEGLGDVVFGPLNKKISEKIAVRLAGTGLGRLAENGLVKTVGEGLAKANHPRITAGWYNAANALSSVMKRAGWDGIPEELAEEWASGVANSVFNLDDDGVTPWHQRVFKSSLGPVADPVEYAKMAIAFSLVPGAVATVGAVSGSASPQEREAAAKAVKDWYAEGKIFRTPEQIGMAAKQLVNVAVNEDYERWWADNKLGDALGFKGKPKPGSLARFIGTDLRDAYLEAVERATRSGDTDAQAIHEAAVEETFNRFSDALMRRQTTILVGSDAKRQELEDYVTSGAIFDFRLADSTTPGQQELRAIAKPEAFAAAPKTSALFEYAVADASGKKADFRASDMPEIMTIDKKALTDPAARTELAGRFRATGKLGAALMNALDRVSKVKGIKKISLHAATVRGEGYEAGSGNAFVRGASPESGDQILLTVDALSRDAIEEALEGAAKLRDKTTGKKKSGLTLLRAVYASAVKRALDTGVATSENREALGQVAELLSGDKLAEEIASKFTARYLGESVANPGQEPMNAMIETVFDLVFENEQLRGEFGDVARLLYGTETLDALRLGEAKAEKAPAIRAAEEEDNLDFGEGPAKKSPLTPKPKAPVSGKAVEKKPVEQAPEKKEPEKKADKVPEKKADKAPEKKAPEKKAVEEKAVEEKAAPAEPVAQESEKQLGPARAGAPATPDTRSEPAVDGAPAASFPLKPKPKKVAEKQEPVKSEEGDELTDPVDDVALNAEDYDADPLLDLSDLDILPSNGKRASFDEDVRASITFQSIMDALNLPNNALTQQVLRESIDSSPGFPDAVLSNKAFAAWMAADPTNDMEKNFKEIIRKGKVARRSMISVLQYHQSTFTPKVFKVKVEPLKFGGETNTREKAIKAAEASGGTVMGDMILTPDPVQNINFELTAEAVRTTLLRHMVTREGMTGKKGGKPGLIDIIGAFVRNDNASAAELIFSVSSLPLKWLTEMQDAGPKFTPKQEEARRLYVRYLTSKSRLKEDQELSQALAEYKELRSRGQKWVDEVAQAIVREVNYYRIKSMQKEADLARLRSRLIDNVFMNIGKDEVTQRKIGEALRARERAGVTEAMDDVLGAEAFGEAADRESGGLTGPRPNLAVFYWLNRHRYNTAPIRYHRPSGKSQNNVLFRNHFVRAVEATKGQELDYSDFALVSGLYQPGGNAADFDAMAPGDQYAVEQAMFNAGKDKYYMWSGQYGDKTHLYFVSVPKVTRGDAMDRNLRAKYQAIWDRLNGIEGRELFLMSPEALDRITDPMKYNYALNMPMLVEAIHGRFESYTKNGKADQSDLVKRASSILTGGITPNTQLFGEELNALILDDHVLNAELRENGKWVSVPKETTDGVAYMVESTAEKYQEAVGDIIARTDEYPTLDTTKSLLSGSDASERSLSKFNFVTLTKARAEQDPDSVEAKIYNLVENYNARAKKEGRKPIQVVFMKSGAKKLPKGKKAAKLFTNDGVTTATNDISIEEANVIPYRTRDLIWVLDARHPAEPESSRRPSQTDSDLIEFGSASAETAKAQLAALVARIAALEEAEGFDPTKQLSAQGNPALAAIVEGREVPDVRTERAVLSQFASALGNLFVPRGWITHPIETPIASVKAALPTMAKVRWSDSEGQWVTLKPGDEGAERVRLSRFNTNLPADYRFTYHLDGSPVLPVQKSLADAEAYVRENIKKDLLAGLTPDLLDLVVLNEKVVLGSITPESVDTWDIQTWEFIRQADGSYVIPGEPGMYTRVPGDSPHSHTYGRLNRRIAGGANFIETPLEDQLNAGADFDVDSRFIELLRKKKAKGSKWARNILSGTWGDYNLALLRWAAVYQDPANFDRFKTGIGLEIYNETIGKYKAAEVLRPLNEHGAGMHYLRESNVVGKTGLGIAASESDALSRLIMHKVKVRLNPFSEGAVAINHPVGKRELVLDLTTDAAVERQQAAYAALKSHFGNLVNLFADHGKLQKITYLGINEVTVKLAATLVYANSQLSSEKDIVDYIDVIAEFLNSNLVKDYTRLARSRGAVLDNVRSDKIWATLEGRYPNQLNEVEFLKNLDAMAAELFELSSYVRSLRSVPQDVLEFKNRYSTFTKIRRAAGDEEALQYFDALGLAPSASPWMEMVSRAMDAMYRFVYGNALVLTPVGGAALNLATATKDGKPPTKTALKTAEQRLRDASATNIAAALYRAAHPGEQKLPTREALFTHLKASLPAWQEKYPGNAFIAAIELRVKALQISTLYQSGDLSEAFTESTKKAFSFLPESVQTEFALYNFMVYGVSTNRLRGSYALFLGNDYSMAFNEAAQREEAFWKDRDRVPEVQVVKFMSARGRAPVYSVWELPLDRVNYVADYVVPERVVTDEDVGVPADAGVQEPVAEEAADREPAPVAEELVRDAEPPPDMVEPEAGADDFVELTGADLRAAFGSAVEEGAAAGDEGVSAFLAGRKAQQAEAEEIADFIQVDMNEAYARFLQELKTQKPIPRSSGNRKSTGMAGNEIVFNDNQQEAYNRLLKWASTPGSRVPWGFSLRGRAGTGKTTILRDALGDMARKRMKILVTATTNVAVNNALAAVGGNFPANTIQSALGLQPDKSDPNYRHDKPVFKRNMRKSTVAKFDLVVVDESSMVNPEVFRHIAAAASNGKTKFLFVGDVRQITPVGSDGKISEALMLDNAYELTLIERTSQDNPLMLYFDLMRENPEAPVVPFKQQTIVNAKGEGAFFTAKTDTFVDLLREAFTSKKFAEDANYARVVAPTHQLQDEYNTTIRRMLFGTRARANVVVGEVLIGKRTVTPDQDDMESFPLSNGTSYRVTKVSDRVHTDPLGVSYRWVDIADVRPEALGGVGATSARIVEPTPQSVAAFRDYVNETQKKADTDKDPAAQARYRHDIDRFLNTYLTKMDIKLDKSRHNASLPSGYAMTAHAAQGQTFTNVFITLGAFQNWPGTRYERNSMVYTALSRAASKAIMLDKNTDQEAQFDKLTFSLVGVNAKTFDPAKSWTSPEGERLMEVDTKNAKVLAPTGTLDKVLDAPELFAAYPQLKDARVLQSAVLRDTKSTGVSSVKANGSMAVVLPEGLFEADATRFQASLLREVQNIIQAVEEGSSDEAVAAGIRSADTVRVQFANAIDRLESLKAKYPELEASYPEALATLDPAAVNADADLRLYLKLKQDIGKAYRAQRSAVPAFVNQQPVEAAEPGVFAEEPVATVFRDVVPPFELLTGRRYSGLAHAMANRYSTKGAVDPKREHYDAIDALVAKLSSDVPREQKLQAVAKFRSAWSWKDTKYRFDEIEQAVRNMPTLADVLGNRYDVIPVQEVMQFHRDAEGEEHLTMSLVAWRQLEMPQLSDFFIDKAAHAKLISLSRDMNTATKRDKARAKVWYDRIKKLAKGSKYDMGAINHALGVALDEGLDTKGGVIFNRVSPAAGDKYALSYVDSTGKEIDGGILVQDIRAAVGEEFDTLFAEIRKATNEQRLEANERSKGLVDSGTWLRFLNNYVMHWYESEPDKPGSKRRRRIEESGRSQTRVFDTYREAAVAEGLLPRSLKATELFVGWQSSVSEVIRNKAYLTYMSQLRDFDGDLTLIPMKDKDKIGREMVIGQGEDARIEWVARDSAISRNNAFATLDQLVDMAKRWGVESARRFKVDRSADPWMQINRLVNEEMVTKLQDHGYEWRETRDFNMTGAWVREGAPAKLLEHIVSKGLADIRNKTLRNTLIGIRDFNNVTKNLALGLSGFHMFALGESWVAAYGLNMGNPLLNPVAAVRAFREAAGIYRRLKSDPKFVEKWAKAGLEFNAGSQDMDTGTLDKIITGMINLSGKTWLTRNTSGKALRALLSVKKSFDYVLWDVVQPAAKLHIAERVLAEVESDPAYAGVNSDALRSDIAAYVNDALGGQEWERYLWANRRTRAIMQALVFAPDWSISALNVAGLPQIARDITGAQNVLSIDNATRLGINQEAAKYWPAFAALVLMGAPAALQAMIYSAFGDPEEGDRMFTWMNEHGRRTHVDITPIVRAINQKYRNTSRTFGTTNRRRVYLRWGKQGWEIGAYFQHPTKAIMSKSSMAVKAFMEQVFGKNSAWWDMPWTDQEGLSLFSVKEKDGTHSFAGSRVAVFLEKFVPMSILSMLQGRPSTFFAPATLGASKYEAVKSMVPLMLAYSDEAVAGEWVSRPLARKALDTAVHDILRSAELNGYNKEVVMQEALQKARGIYYARAFEELNRKGGPRDQELQRTTASLKRLGGMRRYLKNSLTAQFSNANLEQDSPRKRAIAKAWSFRAPKEPGTAQR